jgi:enamine deaminase RidA (YjgF/YER057c/UK114 family)
MSIEHYEQPWGNPAYYSQSVRGGGLIVTCGQLGADPGGPDVPFAVQARTALERMVAAVEAAGGSMATIIKVNAYLQTLDDFPAFDAVYRDVLRLDAMPARTTVEVARFFAPMLVEVDAWAVPAR